MVIFKLFTLLPRTIKVGDTKVLFHFELYLQGYGTLGFRQTPKLQVQYDELVSN